MEKREELFLKTLGNKFRMISQDELLNKVENKNEKKPIILDFRSEQAFNTSRISDSININITDLPSRLNEFSRDREIVALCNGSIQSGYAIYYLFLNGFNNVFNLSGGFSSCLKNNFSLLRFSQNEKE